MKVEVQIGDKAIVVTCPFCPTDPPPPDPCLIETGRFLCPQCRREFVAMNAQEYTDAIVASRPTLLIGELLRVVSGVHR